VWKRESEEGARFLGWPMRMLLGESTVQHRRQILDGVPDGSLAGDSLSALNVGAACS
jgi:hypothetical protein